MLHVGDFDPHGEVIFNALAQDVAAFVEADRTLAIQRVVAARVALTVEQVEAYGLPTDRLRKPKANDRAAPVLNDSWRQRYGDRTCQLEALPPDVLAEIVRVAISERMDWDRWVDCVDEERGIRATLLGLPSGNGHHDDDELPL